MTIIGSICILVGMLYSTALQSIGVVLIVADALWNFKPEKDRAAIAVASALCGVFLLYFLGCWNAQDTDFMLLKWRIKLPFLLLPLAFLFAPAVKERHYHGLLGLFVMLMFVAGLFSFAQYLLDYAAINQAYIQSKVLPTPVHHIRFSLMAAFAVCAGHYLYVRKQFFFDERERYLYLFAAVFLFGFLHLLAVRSGLLAIYLCLLYLAARKMLVGKDVRKTLAILSLVVVLPVGAYLSFPSFQQKLHYSQTYVSALIKGEEINPQHSDIGRFRSIQMGLELARQHPVMGVGIGNLQQEVDKYYHSYFPELRPERRLMPHNQYVYILAGLGTVGLLFFLVCVLTPLVVNFLVWSDPLFNTLNIILLSSFLTESPLETHLGVSFYLIFNLLAMSYFRFAQQKPAKTSASR